MALAMRTCSLALSKRTLRPWRGLSSASRETASPRQLYDTIVQRFESSSEPPRSLLHEYLLAARTAEEGELAASAYRMYARKDRSPLPAESTALLLKSTLRTRNFEPVLALLEASKWNGLLPSESNLQAMQVQLEQEQDWARLERLFRVRVDLSLVSSPDALRSAQRALIAQGKLRAAARLLSPSHPDTARLVRPFMYAALLAGCADAGKHVQTRAAWAQLAESGLAPTPRCVAEAVRGLLADAEGGAAAAVKLFEEATDPAAAMAVERGSALAEVAQALPDFAAEHLAHLGGEAAAAAVERRPSGAAAAPRAQPAVGDAAPAAGAEAAVAPRADEKAKRPAERKEEVLRDGRDDSLI